MGGDYTKFTFKPRNNYSGVRKQQGRVDLDQDWNEEVDIQDRRWRAETRDLIGRCGVPIDDKGEISNGFKITDSGKSFTIGRGRIYVDGLLVENHGAGKPEFDPELAEERGQDDILYENQPFLPNPDPLPAPGLHIVYLDVWQREVTYIEAPDLLEKALGGVDTTTRIQTVWQVKVLDLSKEFNSNVGVTCNSDINAWKELVAAPTGRLEVSADPAPASGDPCAVSPAGGYRGLENRLYRVEIHDGETGDDETGDDAPAKFVTFKWSRDNGSIVAAVKAIDTIDTDPTDADPTTVSIITVETLGRDSIFRFQVGDWVEILDDYKEFHNEPGEMALIMEINEADRQITLDRSIQGDFASDSNDSHNSNWLQERHIRLRRWDQKEKVNGDGLLSVVLDQGGAIDSGDGIMVFFSKPIDIEDGIKVSFRKSDSGGRAFRTGDYWVFAARTVDGSVEVLDNAPPDILYKTPHKVPPMGIHHHYCWLAVIEIVEDRLVVHDCRRPFPVMPAQQIPEQLTSCRGCCTVTVREGDDCTKIKTAINEALNNDKFHTRVCILPGEYRLYETIEINNSNINKSITISGCGRQTHIKNSSKVPVFKLTGSNIYLESLWIEAMDIAIEAKDVHDFGITKCTIDALRPSKYPILVIETGEKGVSESIRIENNILKGGGIWIKSGCCDVSIMNNKIIGQIYGKCGNSPGILLGDEVILDKPMLISRVQIQDNTIESMGGSGITTVHGVELKDLRDVINLGVIEDLSIVGNRIEKCVQNEPDCRFPDETLVGGGIMLTNASGIVIKENYIAQNGVKDDVDDGGHQACGMLAVSCDNLELSDNTIIDNGPKGKYKGNKKYFQAGVALLYVNGNGNEFAARIHNNIINCPAGQSLIVIGKGHISIVDNNLTSYEFKKQPNLSGSKEDEILYDLLTKWSCMLVCNLAIPPTEGNNDLTMVKGNVVTMVATWIPKFKHIPNLSGQYSIVSVGILSSENILINDNQFAIYIPSDANLPQENCHLINVFVSGIGGIQACGNHFKENLPMKPLFLQFSPTSYLSLNAIANIATNNIATNVSCVNGQIVHLDNNIPDFIRL